MDGWDGERTRTAYDEIAETYAQAVTGTDPEQPLELAVVDHFVALLPPGADVLDAGCGAGRMLPYLAERGCRVQGMDLSPEMVRLARRDHPGHPVRVASLTALPYDDASFDGIFCWYSTIHSPDADVAVILREVRRVLRPAGLVLLAFQTGEGERDASQAYRERGHDVTLVRYGRSPAQVTEALRAAGLAPVASMEREATGRERDAQAVVVARAPER